MLRPIARESAQRQRAALCLSVTSRFSNFALPGHQEDRDRGEQSAREEEISSELERAYLTLSWWLLTVERGLT